MMNRRVFLTTFSLSCAALLTQDCQFFMLMDSRPVALKAGDVVIARPQTQFSLPTKPKEGDTVQIVVEAATLKNPSSISYQGTAILGDQEPLILDSIANIKLVYRSQKNNWELA